MMGASCFVRGAWGTLGVLVVCATGVGAQSRSVAATHEAPRTTNVVLVTIDGVRWQEVFRGGDCALMTKEQGVADTLATRAAFCRSTTAEARRALMPFFWDSIVARGTVFGDRDRGGDAHVSNSMKFSYPGYNEILTGAVDPRIDRNEFGPNPHVTVFEWLARRRGFRGQVRVWGGWSVFDAIFNESRAGIPVRSGWDEPFPGPRDGVERELNALWATTTRHWDYIPPDALLQRAVLQSLRADHPRALFVGFGEPDEWAHARRYDHYLESIRMTDRYLSELWRMLQADGRYRGRTALLVVTDHGRGRGAADWTDHGRDVVGAEEIWFVALGSGVPARGLVIDGAPFLQAQVAATVAQLAGEDWRSFNAEAAAPVPCFPFLLSSCPAQVIKR